MKRHEVMFKDSCVQLDLSKTVVPCNTEVQYFLILQPYSNHVVYLRFGAFSMQFAMLKAV